MFWAYNFRFSAIPIIALIDLRPKSWDISVFFMMTFASYYTETIFRASY